MIDTHTGVPSRPSIRTANGLFVIVLMLALGLGTWVQSRSFNWGLLVTEVGVVLVPTLIALSVFKLDWRETLLLRPMPIRTVALSAAIGLLGWPVALLLGALSELALRMIGPLPGPLIPPVTGAGGGVAYLVLFSVLAPLCEEVLARGFIQRAYERQGLHYSTLYGALFFGLFHLSPARFLSTAFLGWIIGQVYARGRSLYGSMVVHAVNNALAASVLIAAGQSVSEPASAETLWSGIGCMAGLALIALPLLIVSLRALGSMPTPEPGPAPLRQPLIHWDFGVIVFLFAAISGIELAARAGLL